MAVVEIDDEKKQENWKKTKREKVVVRVLACSRRLLDKFSAVWKGRR